jgi:hypothetical protein
VAGIADYPAVLGNGSIDGCLIDANTGDGINWARSSAADLLAVTNNTIVGNSGDGVDLLAGTCYLFANNIIARNGAYGIKADAACVIPGYGNLIPSSGADTNTSGALSNVTLAVPSGLPANLTGSQICDFVNVGTSDYRQGKNSAGREYGWPGTMPGLTAPVSTGAPDIGALQGARAYPALSAVWHTTSFGQGDEYTGTKVASSITNATPGNVKDGVDIDDVHGEFVGAGGGGSVFASPVLRE